MRWFCTIFWVLAQALKAIAKRCYESFVLSSAESDVAVAGTSSCHGSGQPERSSTHLDRQLEDHVHFADSAVGCPVASKMSLQV
jgi:hypothetical protein